MIERKETHDELMQDFRSLKLEDLVNEKDYRTKEVIAFVILHHNIIGRM